MQGVGLEALPPEVIDKSLLTRLDLMCNQLEVSTAQALTRQIKRWHLMLRKDGTKHALPANLPALRAYVTLTNYAKPLLCAGAASWPLPP